VPVRAEQLVDHVAYDQQTLRRILEDAGFVDIVRWEPGESGDPALRGVESHGRALGDEDVNRFETLVLEGTRSPSAA
jgi:hypothetical protein